MAKSKLLTLSMCVAFLFSAAACSSLEISNVDYSQPVESVLTVENNEVHDKRYAIKFNISPVLDEEGISSVDEIRLIRSNRGYYFLTASGFNHVYVLEVTSGGLDEKNIIRIPGDALQQPAFNQRDGFIELVDLATGDTHNLDHNGRR